MVQTEGLMPNITNTTAATTEKKVITDLLAGTSKKVRPPAPRAATVRSWISPSFWTEPILIVPARKRETRAGLRNEAATTEKNGASTTARSTKIGGSRTRTEGFNTSKTTLSAEAPKGFNQKLFITS